MLLQDKYYTILAESRQDAENAIYQVALKPDCEVYRGHFPEKPVSPGVCNIEMIKECAMLLTGQKLQIATIGQCRLTAVATPLVCPQLNVTINATPIEGGFKVKANIADAEKTYMEFKGDLKL